MRDHGGNIDWAIKTYGGLMANWMDLSTGINRVPYPLPPVSAAAWTTLPTRATIAGLIDTARQTYGGKAAILPLAGAQAAIQMIPHLGAPGRARVLAPTYNEHAACLRAAGWQVEEVAALADLEGADLAVVVNPNNPDGRSHTPQSLLALVGRVGRLVVDESFADAQPDLSVAPCAGPKGLFVLRSFGKFYGLAGVRLGFVLGHEAEIAELADMAGPWPISGAAIEIGRVALADTGWATATVTRLRQESTRLDDLAGHAAWIPLGGTELFRLYATPDAAEAQAHLARHHIWSRIFPYSTTWLRLGPPGNEAEWARIAAALSARP